MKTANPREQVNKKWVKKILGPNLSSSSHLNWVGNEQRLISPKGIKTPKKNPASFISFFVENCIERKKERQELYYNWHWFQWFVQYHNCVGNVYWYVCNEKWRMIGVICPIYGKFIGLVVWRKWAQSCKKLSQAGLFTCTQQGLREGGSKDMKNHFQ